MKTLRFEIAEDAQSARIDKALGELSGEELSRTRVKALIEDGYVRLNGAVCDAPSKKIKPGDVLEVDVPPPVAADRKRKTSRSMLFTKF